MYFKELLVEFIIENLILLYIQFNLLKFKAFIFSSRKIFRIFLLAFIKKAIIFNLLSTGSCKVLPCAYLEYWYVRKVLIDKTFKSHSLLNLTDLPFCKLSLSTLYYYIHPEYCTETRYMLYFFCLFFYSTLYLSA